VQDIINMDIGNAVYIFILGMTPAHRACVPLGLAIGLGPVNTIAATLAGEFAMISLLVVMFDRIDGMLKNMKIYNRVVERTRKKVSKHVNTYGAFGLFLFVFAPLPGTGYWVGALAAFITGMKKNVAFLVIALGTLMAEIALLLGILGAIEAFKVFM